MSLYFDDSGIIRGNHPAVRTACVILLLVSFVFPFLLSGRVVFNYMDIYLYLDRVKEMNSGSFKLFATQTRSNFFPLLLYSWFEAFGYTLAAVRWLYCLFLMMLSVQSWLLGRLLFNNESGIITALFVTTSYTFAHFVYFPHIDLVLLVFMNFCFLLMGYAFTLTRGRYMLFFLSGLAIGTAYLVKEAAVWLLFFIPLYALLTRKGVRLFVASWGAQLLPFLLTAGVIIVSSGSSFIQRYSHRFEKLYRFFDHGSRVRLITEQNSGWYTQGLDHLPSVAKILLFLFIPIFWQWDAMLPVPKALLCVEQVLLVAAFVWYLLFFPGHGDAKIFLLAVLLLFLPRFLYVAVAGSKVRQVLPFFFILYLPLGHLVSVLMKRIYSYFLPYSGMQRARFVIVLLLTCLYLTRLGLFFNGMDYTLNSADAFYSRPDPLLEIVQP
jgi:hypothetical protein